MARKCVIPSCPNMLSPKARLEECAGCRQVFRYWLKKRPDEIVGRQHQLAKWQERMVRLGTKPVGKLYARAIRKIRAQVERRAA